MLTIIIQVKQQIQIPILKKIILHRIMWHLLKNNNKLITLTINKTVKISSSINRIKTILNNIVLSIYI